MRLSILLVREVSDTPWVVEKLGDRSTGGGFEVARAMRGSKNQPRHGSDQTKQLSCMYCRIGGRVIVFIIPINTGALKQFSPLILRLFACPRFLQSIVLFSKPISSHCRQHLNRRQFSDVHRTRKKKRLWISASCCCPPIFRHSVESCPSLRAHALTAI